jgi:hypothetical protein
MAWGNTRGWRRIGIVLSIIWFVGFGFFLWRSTLEGHLELLRNGLHTCGVIYEMQTDTTHSVTNDDERNRRYAANDAKWKQCQDGAEASYRRGVQDLRTGTFWGVLIAFDAGTLLIAWFVVWIVVLVVRWIGRGFTTA